MRVKEKSIVGPEFNLFQRLAIVIHHATTTAAELRGVGFTTNHHGTMAIDLWQMLFGNDLIVPFPFGGSTCISPRVLQNEYFIVGAALD